MGRRDRYKIITDLFTTGEVIVPIEGHPPVWLQKLNGFEVEEARAHANARRALVANAMRETGSDTALTVRNAADALDREALVTGVVNARYGRHMAEAATTLAADPEWMEKQQVLDRIDTSETLEPDQQKLVNDYNAEYFRRIREGIEEREAETRAECESLDEATLRKEYVDAFIEQRSQTVFTREMRVAEIVMGARICDAEPNELGSYADADHTPCKHDPVFVDEPAVDEDDQPVLNPDGSPKIHTALQQVRELPDALFGIYTQAFDRLNVARHQAKGSASRQSSSEPSRQQNEAAESPASTQEEVPTPPATT